MPSPLRPSPSAQEWSSARLTSCYSMWNRCEKRSLNHPWQVDFCFCASRPYRIRSSSHSNQLGGIVPIPLLAALVIVVLYFLNCIKILREYERGVIFSLGRLLQDAKGPGLIFVFAPIQKMVRIDLRQQALEVPPQDIITRDNVTLKVNAVIYWRVVNAPQAVVQVQNYYW